MTCLSSQVVRREWQRDGWVMHRPYSGPTRPPTSIVDHTSAKLAMLQQVRLFYFIGHLFSTSLKNDLSVKITVTFHELSTESYKKKSIYKAVILDILEKLCCVYKYTYQISSTCSTKGFVTIYSNQDAIFAKKTQRPLTVTEVLRRLQGVQIYPRPLNFISLSVRYLPVFSLHAEFYEVNDCDCEMNLLSVLQVLV